MENKNVYVGHRYVPKIMGEHDKSQSYEGLSIVTHEGTSYTSKKHVPIGVDINNEEYWVVTGNYNVQIEHYRNEVKKISDTVDENNRQTNNTINNFKTDTNNTINNFKTDTNNTINKFKTETNKEINEVRETSTKNSFVNGVGTHNKRPIVSFIADDAPKNDLTKLLPSIKKKNIPFGIAVITDFVGTSNFQNIPLMSWEDLKLMEENGCEILGHTSQHRNNSTTMTLKELEQDIARCKKTLTEHGFNAEGFVYPYNAYNSQTKSIVSKYFKYSFARYNKNKKQTNVPFIDNNAICRVGLGSFPDQPSDDFVNQDTLSYEYYKERVDKAVENNDWLVFTIHTHTTNHEKEQQENLERIVDYIRGLGVEIMLPSKAFQEFGNLIQIENKNGNISSVNSDGTSSGELFSTKIEKINQSTVDTEITDFEKGKITYTPINSTESKKEGYPSHNSGILITHYIENGIGYIRQIYEPTLYYSDTGEIEHTTYVRYNFNNQWKDWKPYFYKTFKNIEMVGLKAFETYDLNINIGNNISNDYLVELRTENLPEGLIYQVLNVNNGIIKARITNVTNELTEPFSLRFDIKASKGI